MAAADGPKREDSGSQHRGQAAFDQALAAALLDADVLDERGHALARTEQLVVGGTLALALWELGLVEIARLSETGAAIARLPLADRADVEHGAAQLGSVLGDPWRAQAGLVPYRRDGKRVLAASCWPWRVDRIDELGFRTGLAASTSYLCDVELMQVLGRVRAAGVPRRYLGRPQRRRAALEEPLEEPLRAAEPDAPELTTEAEFLSLYGELPEREALALARPLHSAVAAEDDEIELTELADSLSERAIASREAALAALDRAWSRRAIGEALVRFGRSRAARVALFSCRAGVWLGWTGSGSGIDPARVAQLMVPIVPKTVFGLVHATASPYVGPLPPHPVHRSFLAALGAQEPASAGLFPIYHRGRLLFVIYLDAGHGQRISPDVSDMLIVAQRVPSALERMIS